MNDPLLVVFALTFPVLLGVTILLAIVVWRGSGLEAPDVLAPPRAQARGGRLLGDLRIVTVWLLLTAVTVVGAFIVGFALVHALLFAFGQGVATVALVGSGIVLAAVPVAWGLVIRHHLRGGRSSR
ncbi:MAG: hypothetical protein FIA92_07320 [Chloroflexi bacterium]|nr:hypothetical protein [Chloroflexota bacterium]